MLILRLSDPHDRGVVARVLAILRRRPQPLRSVDHHGHWRSVGAAWREMRRGRAA